ncbi:MAG TPA: CPXCG motif-containing cysteine-rich protein [Rudaea sp.]|nr:CPXCG motif-containing cysteine-rich protein [Rudaea sp.]
MTETITIQCPYCGESYETVVDVSAGAQRYIEDCAVCCRPIEIALRVGDDGELVDVSTATDND